MQLIKKCKRKVNQQLRGSYNGFTKLLINSIYQAVFCNRVAFSTSRTNTNCHIKVDEGTVNKNIKTRDITNHIRYGAKEIITSIINAALKNFLPFILKPAVFSNRAIAYRIGLRKLLKQYDQPS